MTGTLSLYNTGPYLPFSSLNECILRLVQSCIVFCIPVSFYTHRCLLQEKETAVGISIFIKVGMQTTKIINQALTESQPLKPMLYFIIQ